jgi:WD40 repeat protein
MDNLLDDELNEVMEKDPTPEVDDADNVNVERCGVLGDTVNKGIHSLKFNYNDQYIASGHRDGRVRIFNVVTQKPTCVLDCNRGGNETLVQSVKWRPKIEGRTNNILMTACRDTVMEWHTPSSKIVINQGKLYIVTHLKIT